MPLRNHEKKTPSTLHEQQNVPVDIHFLFLNSKLLATMKKRMEKKLTLGKLKIAKLSPETQAAMQADAAKPTYTGCSLFRCPPPPAGQQ